MKRFHVHVAVRDLARSIDFYRTLFAQAPTVERADYAKWMLEDPRVNFAISARGHAPGLNHFGLQAESALELAELEQRAQAASGGAVFGQQAAGCCYARSDKHWTVDPQGLAWEQFRTLSEMDAFGEDPRPESEACCIPLTSAAWDAGSAEQSCCVPQAGAAENGACCERSRNE